MCRECGERFNSIEIADVDYEESLTELIPELITALDMGLEFAREALARHDRDLGRGIKKNRETAETMEIEIAHLIAMREKLQMIGKDEAESE